MMVFYKCHCVADEVPVYVGDREPGTTTEAWIKRMQEAISTDHRSRSPECRAPTTDYVRIPFDESLPLGSRKAAK